MIRREFLRILTVSGALAALPAEEAEALTAGVRRGTPADFARMNSHLWQVYQLARSKQSVYPVVREQLTTLNEALAGKRGNARPLLNAAADLFQLVSEVAFDANRYADAAASYALAASISKDAGAYDLWSCALVRHAYVDMSEHRYHQAAQLLGVAERLAGRGTRRSRPVIGSPRFKRRRTPTWATWTRVSARWGAPRRSGNSPRTAPTADGSGSTDPGSQRSVVRGMPDSGAWTWRRQRCGRPCSTLPCRPDSRCDEGARY